MASNPYQLTSGQPPVASTSERKFGDATSYYRKLFTGIQRDYVYLPMRFGTIAAAGTSSDQLIFNRLAFLWLFLQGAATDPNTFLVRITDQTGSDPFTNDYVCMANLCGQGGQPKFLPVGKRIFVGTRLNIEVLNDGSGDSDFAEIVLGGVWIFSGVHE